jgi:cytochrome c oxidase assembly protein subunit 15
MKKWLITLSRIEIILLFLVIIAGSVVRMTDSGMGCPDWPKCFGHLIPPTERSQLDWQPNTEFHKNQAIIMDEALFTAIDEFTSGPKYSPENWARYTKHDYAIFNPVHTWIEYINRLLGALSGLPMLALFFISLSMIRKNWRYFALSAAGLFMLGFEAWLGKLVVDGNLIPGSITIHMMGALVLLAIMLVFNAMASKEKLKPVLHSKQYLGLMLIALVFTLLQITLGTQVRELVDGLHQMGVARAEWMGKMDIFFYIHRSFSILILGLNFYLWWTNRKNTMGYWQWNWVMGILIAEVALGIILAYFDLPKFAQPLHLLLATVLFTFQLHAIIQLAQKGQISPIKN